MKTQKKIEKNVVSVYKKIEDGVVSGYKKVEGKFVDAFLTDDEHPDDAATDTDPDSGKK